MSAGASDAGAVDAGRYVAREAASSGSRAPAESVVVTRGFGRCRRVLMNGRTCGALATVVLVERGYAVCDRCYARLMREES
jgi:hypothetical protein